MRTTKGEESWPCGTRDKTPSSPSTSFVLRLLEMADQLTNRTSTGSRNVCISRRRGDVTR